jgi:hypothetical protein
VARNATLLVTPKEAELLALASMTGNPRLVLRGSRDGNAQLSDGSGISLGELRGDKPKDDEPSAWSKMATAMSNWAQQAQIQTPPQQTSLFNKPDTAPATQPWKPTRQVTVIRNTKQENVQLDAPEPPSKGPVMADTKDTTDGK